MRHKVGKAVEFGRKLWLEEVENDIISGYRLLAKSGQDYAYFADSLDAHRRERWFRRGFRFRAGIEGRFPLEKGVRG